MYQEFSMENTSRVRNITNTAANTVNLYAPVCEPTVTSARKLEGHIIAIGVLKLMNSSWPAYVILKSKDISLIYIHIALISRL